MDSFKPAYTRHVYAGFFLNSVLLQNMKRTLFLIPVGILMLLLSEQVKAQATYSQDLNGSPIKVSRYLDVKGSPFLFDSWLPALVQLTNGQTYQLDIKYDLVADELLFKDKKGDSLNFVLPIREFKFTAPLEHIYRFKSGYPPSVANTGKNTLYEVLYEGKYTLLKKISKTVWEESTTYGTATRTRNISSKNAYFIFDGSAMKPFKPQKKYLAPLFEEKSSILDQFIKSNNLDLNKDEDLIKVFTLAAEGK